MSNELNVAYPGDSETIYAILRRRSDQKVWSTVAGSFGTWADGSIADYDVALTAKSGDLYSGDMPAAVTANTRIIIFYYLQDGASPTITDLALSTADVFWDGQATTEGDTVSLASGGLTTLAKVKRYMRITNTASDNLLTDLINQVSDRIKRIVGRDLVATDYRQRISGDREDTLVLGNYPIISIDRLASGRSNSVSVRYGGSDIRAALSVYDSGVRLRSIAADGTVTTTSVDYATYPTASTLVTQINTIADWTAVLDTDVPSADFNLIGGIDAKSNTIWLTYPDDDDVEYDANHERGLIERRSTLAGLDDGFIPPDRSNSLSLAPRGFVNVLVQYRAGYETLPDDINLTANELIAEAFNRGTKDTTLTTESIDNYSYAIANETELTDRQFARLAPYMELR